MCYSLTIQETKQRFEAMETTRRKEVIEILHNEMKSEFCTYFAHLGYLNPISAADTARALAVKISTPPNIPIAQRFGEATDVIKPFMEVNVDFIHLEKACAKYMVPFILLFINFIHFSWL